MARPPSREPDREELRGGSPAQERELRARGKRTLRRLLAAGTEVFATRGYHAARVDDIVKVARTSHGTFYLYFANKEDLFRALAMDVADQMTELANSLGPVSPAPDGYRELREWLARFADLHDQYGSVIRAWTEAEIGNSDFGRLGTKVLGEFSQALATRIGERDTGLNPNLAALALVAMIERFSYYVLAGVADLDRDEMLDTLATITHLGLFAGKPRCRTAR